MTLRARTGLVTLFLLFFTAFTAFFSSQVQAAGAVSTAGSSCGGRVNWKLVDAGGAAVQKASQAKFLNICSSGFASAENLRAGREGVTLEVSWSELQPFRQRLAGWTVFFNETPVDITGSAGNYRACTNLAVAGGWAHDEYCPTNLLTGCINALEVTCNEQAQRFWTPDNQPYGNDYNDAWTEIIIPSSQGKDVSQGREGYDKNATAIDPYNFCAQVPGSLNDDCLKCVGDDPLKTGKVYTALGCIRVDNKGLAEDVVRLFLGVVGGAALFFMIMAAFIFTTSQGETNKVKQAKEMMTAAISGLFFIVFSIFILQFVGVSILRIPGLG